MQQGKTNISKFRKIGVLFWTVISLSLGVLIMIYSMMTDRELFVIALIPILSLGGYILGARKRKQISFYPRNWVEYLVGITVFFLIFFISYVYLNQEFLIIKIGLFVIFSLVGAFNTISILIDKNLDSKDRKY
jgi:hypothetical protein